MSFPSWLINHVSNSSFDETDCWINSDHPKSEHEESESSGVSTLNCGCWHSDENQTNGAGLGISNVIFHLKVSNSTPDSKSSDEREKEIYDTNQESVTDNWLSSFIIRTISDHSSKAHSKWEENHTISVREKSFTSCVKILKLCRFIKSCWKRERITVKVPAHSISGNFCVKCSELNYKDNNENESKGNSYYSFKFNCSWSNC